MNYVPYIIILTLLISCGKKKDPTFSIEGSISPVITDYLLLFEETDIERKISTFIDTIPVDAEGNFKADFLGRPYVYKLVFDDKKSLELAINKGQKIHLEITDLNQKNFKKKVSGSADAEALLAYENFREQSLETLVRRIRRQITALKESDAPDQVKIDSLGILEIVNYDKHITELNTYVKEKMGTTIGLYATSIRWRGEENIELFDSLVEAYQLAHPELEITSRLREKIKRIKQTSIGGIAADIDMKSVNGEGIKLTDINKKYTLIDFWASWCGPCRRESESLNNLYQKYKKEGFEIYGVSLDSDRDKWVNALEKDKRIWANVSSLEGFKTPAAFNYAVTALPDNYLIDAERKILAKNIHGEDLETLLDSLLVKN